ncbi:hypothetical protein T484DRAFT_1755109 [Baffinella frigidus]|nr:hypothetical protein T484DRAFT_1755109 [Cryptophyta sp. CCMP2293]
MLLRSDFRWAETGHTHRKAPRRAQRSKSTHRAPTPIVDKELMYEVEKVVKRRTGDWGPEYLVKWKGYAECENSWIGELPIFFRTEYPFYKQSSSLMSDSESGSDSDDEESDDEESDDEESEEEEEVVVKPLKRKRRARSVVTQYLDDTESDSD